uniref:Uncharacterized protein n=1 Tax=Anguilla anguilla TaxID=7936 RepID=A0A0E9X662_ANGAN
MITMTCKIYTKTITMYQFITLTTLLTERLKETQNCTYKVFLHRYDQTVQRSDLAGLYRKNPAFCAFRQLASTHSLLFPFGPNGQTTTSHEELIP